jgi:hypothetical protein
VSGSHTYNTGGIFPLTVTATEGTRTATGIGQAIVKTVSLHARAYGVQSINPPQGPFGDVSIPPTGGNQTAVVPSVLLPGLLVSTITDTVSGSLTPAPAHADASSTIGSLNGFGIIASGITATAHADLSTPIGILSGSTTFASLIAGGTIYQPNFAPAPNTVVQFTDGSGFVVLNEQTVTQNANQILIVVNALHIHVTQGTQAGTDIVVGHVEAGFTLS